MQVRPYIKGLSSYIKKREMMRNKEISMCEERIKGQVDQGNLRCKLLFINKTISLFPFVYVLCDVIIY